MPAIQPCDGNDRKCDQHPKFALFIDDPKQKEKVKPAHACADHVEDLRASTHSVYRYDPISGKLGEKIREADVKPKMVVGVDYADNARESHI